MPVARKESPSQKDAEAGRSPRRKSWARRAKGRKIVLPVGLVLSHPKGIEHGEGAVGHVSR